MGDTLDDGTTLNQYSEALYKVGVNIKTASGDLKEMDDIIDELGPKWKTLADDQKMALAQTVAGRLFLMLALNLFNCWKILRVLTTFYK